MILLFLFTPRKKRNSIIMESKGSKQNVLLQKELPFGQQIPRHCIDQFQSTTNDVEFISRQEFLRLLEINVNNN